MPPPYDFAEGEQTAHGGEGLHPYRGALRGLFRGGINRGRGIAGSLIDRDYRHGFGSDINDIIAAARRDVDERHQREYEFLREDNDEPDEGVEGERARERIHDRVPAGEDPRRDPPDDNNRLRIELEGRNILNGIREMTN